jgi:hypothetical protein
MLHYAQQGYAALLVWAMEWLSPHSSPERLARLLMVEAVKHKQLDGYRALRTFASQQWEVIDACLLAKPLLEQGALADMPQCLVTCNRWRECIAFPQAPYSIIHIDTCTECRWIYSLLAATPDANWDDTLRILASKTVC